MLLAFSFSQDQTVIGPGLYGEELFDLVIDEYKPQSTLGYGPARDIMYSVIDLQENNQLSGVYSGYTITLDLSQDPSSNAYSQGINCEHTWPQSLGAGSEPQRSDMHHLFPCKDNVNSSRGNSPFAEISDSETDIWYRNNYSQNNIPTVFIDEYAEKHHSSNNDRFEPREGHKGNTARSMFYFYAMYNDDADDNFWVIQKDELLQWHYTNPVDDGEYNRTWAIADYQDYPNPFVLDSTLARRLWFQFFTNGDLTNDGVLDVLDLVQMVSIIIGEAPPTEYEFLSGNITGDNQLDILDVVSLVTLIIEN